MKAIGSDFMINKTLCSFSYYSPDFLINHICNLAIKEHCISFLDPQHKSVKCSQEFSLCFAVVDTTLLFLSREEWFTGCSKHKRLRIPGVGSLTHADNTLYFKDFLVLCCHNPQLCSGQISHFTNVAFADTESDLSLISTGANYHQLYYAIWHQVGLVFRCSVGGEVFS